VKDATILVRLARAPHHCCVSRVLLILSEPWLPMPVLAICIITTQEPTLFVSAAITPVGLARLVRPQHAFLALMQHNVTSRVLAVSARHCFMTMEPYSYASLACTTV
jgi:hypothetical protein